MSKMSFVEIIEFLKNAVETIDVFSDLDYSMSDLGLGQIVEVYSRGGPDKGSDWCKVYHIVDHDIHIQLSGYYSSYEGVEFPDGWGNATEVKPASKTITVYE